jgi:hypothetical protein
MDRRGDQRFALQTAVEGFLGCSLLHGTEYVVLFIIVEIMDLLRG